MLWPLLVGNKAVASCVVPSVRVSLLDQGVVFQAIFASRPHMAM
jgi:hypothetical protein